MGHSHSAGITERGVGEAHSPGIPQCLCRWVGWVGEGVCVMSDLPGAERGLLNGGAGRGLAEGLKVLDCFIPS